MALADSVGLNGTWAIRDTELGLAGEAGCRDVCSAPGEWLPAEVPGEVHVDLLRAGRLPDPEVGDHARNSRWPEDRAWWYRTTFQLPEGFREHERQWLVFDGIDLYGQVFVNGTLVGEARNAFVPASFSVRRLLRAGGNELVVRATAGAELAPGERPTTSGPDLYAPRDFPGRRFLRKPQYSYGWDWNDPLPNIGLWREVHLEGRSYAVIYDLRLDTIIEGEEVFLAGEASLENLHPWAERPCVLEITVRPPNGAPLTCRIEREVPMGRTVVPCRVPIPDPQLWWPNGMGAQPLYQVTARLLKGVEECDAEAFSVGLRTIEIDRSPLPDGSRFCFRVNGVEVFCKGGNWAPADMVPARVTPERYQALVAEARNAHFTMFRMNGVGLYEGDAFFEACDRAGILVWQDFAFACAEYPDEDPGFRQAVAAEAEAVVRRLRHHPSLALWCGGNECLWGISEWLNTDVSDPEAIGGVRLYGQVLPEVCRRLDPGRPYWPCSPYGGQTPNSESAGNCHWWHPFFMSPDMTRRLRHETVDECRARFVSEYGVIGPCHLDSVREYLRPEEQSLGSAGWRIHTNRFEGGTVGEGIRYHYGDLEGLSLEEFLLYGQLFQAVVHGGAIEALRFRKGDPAAECWGGLIWSYNDCWGEMGWSIIDHYLRRKPAYYWFRRGCAAVKVIVRPRDGHLVTRVVNDALESAEASVECGWSRTDGTQRDLRRHSISIPANGTIEVAREPLPAPEDRNPREWLYGAVLTGEGLAQDQAIWLLRPFRELALQPSELSVSAAGDELEVVSSAFCHAVHMDDHGREVLSDNYFDLLPGVPRRVHLARGAPAGAVHLEPVLPIACGAQLHPGGGST
jgi:beta-mannosidase